MKVTLSEPFRKFLDEQAVELRAKAMSDDNDLAPFLRQFIDWGELKGKLKGKAEGKLEGKREMLLHLLNRSGIVLTAGERQRIEACSDGATIDRWFDNSVGAKTAADVFA